MVMTDKLKAWTERIIAEINSQIEANWPLSDEKWDKVMDKLGDIYQKTGCNKEVQTMLFDAMRIHSQREMEERRKAVAGRGKEPEWM